MSDDLPTAVCTAFGVPAGAATRLPGGSGTCWQVNGLVLKPGQHPTEAAWTAETFAGLRGPGFQVPQPVRAVDGSWVADGWVAWTAVEGEPDPLGRWPELVAVSRAFHAALEDVPAPDWVRRGNDRWSRAERVVWEGASVAVAPELADLVDALRSATRPVRLRDQLIHGDLAGNVLFAPGGPPTVIDFSPSRRPAGFALAVAAVDLLAWSAAPPSILDDLTDEDIDQLMLRALMWRLITESLGRPDQEGRQAVRRANEPVVDLLLSRVSGRSPTLMLADSDVAELTGRVLGCEIVGLRPVTGGHSRSVVRLADRADGGEVFVKTTTAAEVAVYETLDGPFLPRLLALTREPTPMVVLEALEKDGWAPAWTPNLIAATRALLHEVHVQPAPPGVPVLRAAPNPWEAIAADPQRLLRMGVCSRRWLSAHLGTLHAAAAQAPTEGTSLIHRDVRAANLWCRNDRVVLADWASAVIGDPWLDYHLWLVALHAEGGPAPETAQGPHAPEHAALIAGQQPLLTPARDANPALFTQRCRRLSVALSWAARLLRIPSPA